MRSIRIVLAFIAALTSACAYAAFTQVAVNGTVTSNFVLPSARQTTWQPGVTYNSIPASGAAGNTIPSNYLSGGYGIPARATQCGSALTPIGGASSDTAQIIAAMNACTAGQHVQLNCGVFNILTPINYTGSGYISLRGCGPGQGLNVGTSAVAGTGTFTSDATATQLYYGNSTAGFGPVISIGHDPSNPGSMKPLTADMVVGSFTATVSSASGISVGDIVRIDQNTDNDPDVYWGPNHCFAGAQFIGSVSGTTLTVSSIISGTILTTATGGQTVYLDAVGVGRGAAQINSQLTGSAGSTGTYQLNSSQTLAGGSYATSGCATRAFFMRQDRSLAQLFEVASIVSNTLTFTTPARHTYCAGSGSCSTTPGVTSGEAQLTTFGGGAGPTMWAVGIEEMQVSFGSSGNGNIIIQGCAYCWVKHVESYWSNGASILLSNCFRCEVRDSFLHETPNPSSGGAGYLMDFQWGTSDSLYENSISWSGDKQIVGQTTGGGNVTAYNYLADAFQAGFPSLPESGLNEAHNTTSKFGLQEGNESHKYSGDTYWGNNLDMTIFRNNFTDLRPAYPPLNSWVSGGGCPYIDDGTRAAIDIQTSQYRTNVVGNIIGQSGQSLLNKLSGACQFTQTSFSYEDLTMLGNGQTVYDWYIGEIQSGVNSWDPTTYVTQLRQGNWSWYLGAQTWYAIPIGATGSTSTGSALVLPNSYYLVQGETQPAFYATSNWCPCTWPFVNPSNGTTNTLPAKARFLSGQIGGNYNQL